MGSMPATSQLDWLISMTAMIVLFWSRATRDLLKSFGWGIAALHRLHAATKLPSPRRPPHSVSRSHQIGGRNSAVGKLECHLPGRSGVEAADPGAHNDRVISAVFRGVCRHS